MKNASADGCSNSLCIHQLFEQHAAETPDSLALVSSGTRYSYSELNRQANQLAHYLIERGVGANSRVGILMDRSCEMVIAVLGILKAGGAYVPYDSTYPQARLASMLQDIGLKHLLSMNRLLEYLPDKNTSVITLDGEKDAIAQKSSDNPRQPISSEDLAYV